MELPEYANYAVQFMDFTRPEMSGTKNSMGQCGNLVTHVYKAIIALTFGATEMHSL
jgi:hypothetical protein